MALNTQALFRLCPIPRCCLSPIYTYKKTLILALVSQTNKIFLDSQTHMDLNARKLHY